MITSRVLDMLPISARNRVEAWGDAFASLLAVRNPRVLASMAPSAIRGLILQRGRQGEPTTFKASHQAWFDWDYPADHPEMADLYRRAKAGQWDGERDIDWATPVDPMNPEVPLLPEGFLAFDYLAEQGVHLDAGERMRFRHSVLTWLLSQFLHGEQGALMAACQVTEAVQVFDGKYYGATQVMDEARHVEVFDRYLTTKLGRRYHINDNLFAVIDALMSDSRWDMKFLGMQIMVEGLALGAFGTLYQTTSEPVLRNLLRLVIQDEARHVHYGVLALRDHILGNLDEAERIEREDWAFEMSILMRNRFLAWDIYDEWFVGLLTRAQWRVFMNRSKGMVRYRHTMFHRLVPNLREIGLLTPRIRPYYDAEGLGAYFDGPAAPDIDGAAMIDDLEAVA